MSTDSPFDFALRREVRETIMDLVKQGTCAMSADNLFQCVKPPMKSLAGAPSGPEEYRERFDKVIAEHRDVQAFILEEQPEPAEGRQP